MNGVDKKSRCGEENNITADVENGGNKSNGDVLVEINDVSNKKEKTKAENVCRICHFVDEESSGDCQLITLGCDCRGELGVSHRLCAAAWFSRKGNRICEICGKIANNVNNHMNERESAIFMMDLNEMRLVMEALDNFHESSRRCKMSLCNLLLLCLLLIFFLPWLFRGIDML